MRRGVILCREIWATRRSESEGEFEAAVDSILLDRIFHILGPAGIEIFFIEKVVGAGGYIQMLAKQGGWPTLWF